MEKVEMELTPELRKKLASCTGIELSQTWDWVPEEFRDRDEKGEWEIDPKLWTRFKLRSLSGLDSARLKDECNIRDHEGHAVFLEGKHQVETLRRCLKGWENLYNPDYTGRIDWKPAYIKDGMLTDAALSQIPEALRSKIWMAILLHEKLSEEERLGLGS